MTPAILALLDAAAARHGVSAALVRAVAWVESRGNPLAKSSAGAMGVMQLMPATAEGLGVKDPYNTAQNIEGGVRFLARLLATHAVPDALAAYNWGPGNVQREQRGEKTRPARTRKYIENVLARARIETEALERGASTEGTPPSEPPLAPTPAPSQPRPRCCPCCGQVLPGTAGGDVDNRS